jgi:DNA-binding GntR family transcriptional regulator
MTQGSFSFLSTILMNYCMQFLNADTTANLPPAPSGLKPAEAMPRHHRGTMRMQKQPEMGVGAPPTEAGQQPGPRAALVYRALRRAIIEQALAPGSKLPEDTIGEQFGVSRTLVREALARLASEGLVEQRHNRGAAVAYPSLEEARDVFVVRRAMEMLAVEQLCGRLKPEDTARLEAHLAAEQEAHQRGGLESIRLAGEFHLLLAELTGNALLNRYINELASRCSLILAIYGRPHSSECAVNEHRLLISALQQGDAQRCRKLMDEHLAAVMDRALIARRPERDVRDILARYANAEGLLAAAPPPRLTRKARTA